MTREEAIAKAAAVAESKVFSVTQAENNYGALSGTTQASGQWANSLGYSVPLPTADVLVDRLIALGLLKLEEPKTVEEAMEEDATINDLALGIWQQRTCERIAPFTFSQEEWVKLRRESKFFLQSLKRSGFKIVRET